MAGRKSRMVGFSIVTGGKQHTSRSYFTLDPEICFQFIYNSIESSTVSTVNFHDSVKLSKAAYPQLVLK
jgi:hypothetical protein